MDEKNETSAASAKPLERISIGPSQRRNIREIQNFLLVWLDANINNIASNDCQSIINRLRAVVDAVCVFVNVDECVDFITETKYEKVFMIISGDLGQTAVPMAHDIPQLSEIYILRANDERDEEWARQWSKLRGVFTDITSVCEALKRAVRYHELNSVSLSFVQSNDRILNQNMDQLDQSFMYTKILKEILLTIDFEQKHFKEFLMYWKEQFVDNARELKNIDRFEREYRNHTPIWWYTYPCFLYSMINRALRTTEVDIIIKMGFFVRDLHNHITALHAEQYSGRHHLKSFIVYRGQGLSLKAFDQLKKTQGGLISFNNFLSTSRARDITLGFIKSGSQYSDTIDVLFKMTIDPSISSASFANVNDDSFMEAEEEVLFSMHSIFRIGQIEQIDRNDRLWQVNLVLTNDNDPALHALTERIREETFPRLPGWPRLGQLLLKMGEFDKAEKVYETLLEQVDNETERVHIYDQLGKVKYSKGKYEEAITFYEKSVRIYQKHLSSDHPSLPTSYNNMGAVYQSMGDYSKALSYYDKGLEIIQKTLPANHPNLATSYGNIGAVYDHMGKYSKALSYYEQSLEIKQKTLPANHPDLAASYNNIGAVYDQIGDYSKALSYYEQSLEIYQKTLPANHPNLATCCNNIAGVYDQMGEYSKALSYLESALEIKRKSLPSNHPNLASSYSNIGLLHRKVGKYSEALSFLHKAIEMYKNLSSNHPNLANAYNNIALVYDIMDKYRDALLFHKKAIEIRREVLPPDHPDLATSYNNIGLVYDKLDNCTEALRHHEQALEIYQKTLPTNHPHLAACFNNMGEVYFKMSEYSKALSFYQHALDILQRSLPPSPPDLRTVKENIEKTKKKL